MDGRKIFGCADKIDIKSDLYHIKKLYFQLPKCHNLQSSKKNKF